MDASKLIGALEVLREQLIAIANVEIVGLIEAIKQHGETPSR
jgi:hypothetical protein